MAVRTGRVLTYSTSTRAATVDGLTGDIAVLRHVTAITVGDTAVVLQESGRAWVVGVLGLAPQPEPPAGPTDSDGSLATSPPAPPLPEGTGLPVRPTFSGSYRAGAWRLDTSDLYQGDYSGRGINTGGCWWGRLPDGVQSAVLHLHRGTAGNDAATAPTLCLLAGDGPAGAPSIVATTPGPAMSRGEQKTWPVPAAWLTYIATTGGGIGCTSSGSRTPYLSLEASGVGMTLTLHTT